jgi:hypothetical protein
MEAVFLTLAKSQIFSEQGAQDGWEERFWVPKITHLLQKGLLLVILPGFDGRDYAGY